eukprot:5032125-Amphidinium_carterae.1
MSSTDSRERWSSRGGRSLRIGSTLKSGCEMELDCDHAMVVSQLFDTKARVVFASAAQATEKHGLFREKHPEDRGCKIFVNRAQTADRQKGDFILRRCRDCLREHIRLAYGSKVIYCQMRAVACLCGS